jgi:hypothetical protein
MASHTQPRFIIRSADGLTFYLTVTVWTFDPGDAGSPNPKALRDNIQGRFEALIGVAPLQAVQVPDQDAVAFAAMAT